MVISNYIFISVEYVHAAVTIIRTEVLITRHNEAKLVAFNKFHSGNGTLGENVGYVARIFARIMIMAYVVINCSMMKSFASQQFFISHYHLIFHISVNTNKVS